MYIQRERNFGTKEQINKIKQQPPQAPNHQRDQLSYSEYIS